MTAAALADDLARYATRAGELLADGGHRADGDEVRAAVARVAAEVIHGVHEGALGVDAAVAAVGQIVCDRAATRLLQGRAPAEALHDVAVLHALLEQGYPTRWFEASCRDGVA